MKMRTFKLTQQGSQLPPDLEDILHDLENKKYLEPDYGMTPEQEQPKKGFDKYLQPEYKPEPAPVQPDRVIRPKKGETENDYRWRRFHFYDELRKQPLKTASIYRAIQRKVGRYA